MLMKVCPRCGRLKPVNASRYCDECVEKLAESKRGKRDYAREYAKRSEKPRDKYDDFYRSRDWRMTSRAYSQSVGHRCEECGGIGTDVHHKVPIKTDEGWERRFDFENLALLCVRCHNIADSKSFGRRNGKPRG